MSEPIQQLKSRPVRTLIGYNQNVPASAGDLTLEQLKLQVFPLVNAELLNEIVTPTGEIELLVANLEPEKFKQLQDNYQHFNVEVDELLDIFRPTTGEASFLPNADANIIPAAAEEFTVTLVVKDINTQTPIPQAGVYLIGSIWYANGITDKNGEVSLTLYGETSDTLKGLMVKPARNYWSFWLPNPALPRDQPNTVYLRPLQDKIPNFPQQEVYGWGQQAMKLNAAQVPYRGNGVKVAIIDSGGYLEHLDLPDEATGADFTKDATETSWQQDTIGHGSHVAGVIGGLIEATGIRGFAPDADYYVFKIFPGGTFSALIDSLNQCIEAQVDLVNLSLGSSKYSEQLVQKIREATDAGVACIAAAGNSATKIQYPAAYDDVLAVAAIGQHNTFPTDSGHNRQIGQYQSTDGQYFAAKFTCFAQDDQRMDVCAPGVAVTSPVPNQPDAYAAWDGTSMACPHVVGLAALILESREDIRTMPRGRARVEALFQAIRASADDLGLPPDYQGSGLPNVLKALNLQSETSPGEGDGDHSGDEDDHSPDDGDGTDNSCDTDGSTEVWQQVEELLKEALQLLKDQASA